MTSKSQLIAYSHIKASKVRKSVGKTKGLVIASHEGSIIRSTLDAIQTPQITHLVIQLAAKGKGVVRDLDPEVINLLLV